jgi:hypothetical protein
MRTLTARSIRPADTTTPILELDMSFRTMGTTCVEVVDAIVHVCECRKGAGVARKLRPPWRFGEMCRSQCVRKQVNASQVIDVGGKTIACVVN